MSPGYWRQLIDIYTLPEPEINDHFLSEMIEDQVVKLKTPCGWELTDRGNFLMGMLSSIPLPVKVWVDPREVK
jgi:hypothetical protein